jgi:hypothetical protein
MRRQEGYYNQNSRDEKEIQPVGHFKAIVARIARIFAPAEVPQNLQRSE